MKQFLQLAAIFLLVSCEKNLMFHPNEVRPVLKGLNAANIQKLVPPANNTFKFIVTGDTQLSNNEVVDFVDHVNTLNDIAFVVINGDLTEFGLNHEYNLFGEQINKLHVPFISAIGNHDMLSNGRVLYKEMFGEENFTFQYGNSKFVVMNTNGRETGFDGTLPNLNWLQSEIASSDNAKDPENIFFISHIAPFSGDFDPQLSSQFHSVLSANPSTRISIHGHDHNYSLTTPYDNFPYLVVSAVSKRKYAVVTVTGTEYTIEEKSF